MEITPDDNRETAVEQIAVQPGFETPPAVQIVSSETESPKKNHTFLIAVIVIIAIVAILSASAYYILITREDGGLENQEQQLNLPVLDAVDPDDTASSGQSTETEPTDTTTTEPEATQKPTTIDPAQPEEYPDD